MEVPAAFGRLERAEFERALAARLVAAHNLDAAAVDRAFRLQATSNDRLEQILTTLGLVPEHEVATAIAAELGLPLAKAADFPDEIVVENASAKFLRQARVLPLADTAERVVLAMADPLDRYPVRAFEVLTGKEVAIRVAAPSDLDAAYERLYGGEQERLGDLVDDIA